MSTKSFDRTIEDSVSRALGTSLTIDEIRDMPIDEMARRAQEADGGRPPRLAVPVCIDGKLTYDSRALDSNPEKAYQSAMRVGLFQRIYEWWYG